MINEASKISKKDSMESKRFFKPFKGKEYEKGICGKKVLVVGASFYCKRIDCTHFDKCTDVQKKDSSEYNMICECKDRTFDIISEALLENAPESSIYNSIHTHSYKEYRTIKAFGNFMADYVEEANQTTIWNYMAFTNYIQFFLPSKDGKYAQTASRFISERDFEAFKETLLELKPDVVFIWGTPVSDSIRINRKEVYDYNTQKFHDTDGYICHFKMDGLKLSVHIIPVHRNSELKQIWKC